MAVAETQRTPVDATMVKRRVAQFTSRSIKSGMKAQGLRMCMGMVDLTTLEGKDSPEKVRALCAKARNPAGGSGAMKQPVPAVAAVCVYPNLVRVAKEALRGSDVKVAAVATGFPSGQYPLDIRLRDVRDAVEALGMFFRALDGKTAEPLLVYMGEHYTEAVKALVADCRAAVSRIPRNGEGHDAERHAADLDRKLDDIDGFVRTVDSLAEHYLHAERQSLGQLFAALEAMR